MYSSGRRPEIIFENLSGIRICRHFYPVEVGLASSGIRKRREITRLLNLLISKLLISLILSKFFMFLSSGICAMIIKLIMGLSAILDIGVLNLLKNPVWILFKLYIYLYSVPQV